MAVAGRSDGTPVGGSCLKVAIPNLVGQKAALAAKVDLGLEKEAVEGCGERVLRAGWVDVEDGGGRAGGGL